MNTVAGAIMFFSERFGGKPFNNCLLLAIMVVLRWMGYDIKDGDDDRLRAATGVADKNAAGKIQGLSFTQAMVGVAKFLAGRSGPTLVALGDEDLINSLKVVGARGRNKACYAVVVDTGKLPPHYQRWVGQNYDDLHGIAVVATTSHSVDDLSLVQVFILDPMQPSTPPEGFPAGEDWDIGELIPWSLLAPALRRNKDGKIKAICGYKNTAK